MDEKTRVEAYKVGKAWETGELGHFLQNLAEALWRADGSNTVKIKKTWPEQWSLGLEYYQKYLDKDA